MKETVKTTIELPVGLYREVKAKSAIEGLHVREVTIALYQQWLKSSSRIGGDSGDDKWLDQLMSLAVTELNGGPTARDIIEADRDRLEGKGGK